MSESQELTPHEKARLALAARIAAGMAANPNVYLTQGWQAVVARESMAVADKLIMLAHTGGC